MKDIFYYLVGNHFLTKEMPNLAINFFWVGVNTIFKKKKRVNTKMGKFLSIEDQP
jgi:hypothetical protein